MCDDNQHTTAHDLALIMQAAINTDGFRDMCVPAG